MSVIRSCCSCYSSINYSLWYFTTSVISQCSHTMVAHIYLWYSSAELTPKARFDRAKKEWIPKLGKSYRPPSRKVTELNVIKTRKHASIISCTRRKDHSKQHPRSPTPRSIAKKEPKIWRFEKRWRVRSLRPASLHKTAKTSPGSFVNQTDRVARNERRVESNETRRRERKREEERARYQVDRGDILLEV